MEIKPAGRIPYTEKVWNEFKIRLSDTLRNEALDNEQIFSNPDYKNFIVSYVESELLSQKKDNERLILGTNIRLAHMDIETSEGTKTYPIINEYKVHHLMKTYYFYKADDGIKMGCVEVNKKSIIIT